MFCAAIWYLHSDGWLRIFGVFYSLTASPIIMFCCISIESCVRHFYRDEGLHSFIQEEESM